MDQPKMERLLRLMMMLSNNIDYTIDEIATRLSLSPRTIYRYLDTFKSAGFVVQRRGEVYRICKESRHLKDLSQLVHFTDEEAYIVNRLIDSLDDGNLLKTNLKRKLASIYDSTSLADMIVKGNQAANVHALVEAIELQRTVVLRGYCSSHTAHISDRCVEPFAFTTNYADVWCYDLGDGSNKLFKTSRIGNVETTSNGWSHKADHHQLFVDVFRMSDYTQQRVVIQMGLLARNLLVEEYPLAERDITQIAPDCWQLDTLVTNYRGVGRFVIGLADDVEIIENESLRDYVRNFMAVNQF